SRGAVDLVFGFHLPDTLEIALVGRPAHCLVQHPWFASDDWTITQVRRSKGAAPRTTVTVMTGDQPFSLPWRRLLKGI
ncbi:MAG: hypothetical protein M3Y22_02350, partial [Pseudomonadota bacterium]|nr:hypothetical protein [Pseudomonadota bacterium]